MLGRIGIALALPLLGIACGLFADPQPDGASCSSNDECQSEHCVEGMCMLSSCNHTGDCRAGFECDEPKTWEEVLSFGLADGACVPTCAVCPLEESDRWSCSGGDSGRCFFDGAPHVDAGGPYEAVLGEPLRLSVDVDLAPGREIQSVEWLMGGLVVGDTLELDIVLDTLDPTFISVVVLDDENGYGTDDASIRVCSPEGGICNPYLSGQDCCDPSHECRDDADDGEYHCMPRPD